MIRQGKLNYVRVGTLDNSDLCPPDVQIFTSSKQKWVPLDPGIPSFEELYKFEELWPDASYARFKAVFA